MKFAVVCAPGIGDALILQIAAHQLSLHGFDVELFTPHRFGVFFPYVQYGKEIHLSDAILLQHDNSPRAKEIHALDKPVYTFYGAHLPEKHGLFRKGFDYVCDPNQTMVANVIACLKELFHIDATSDNGLKPPANMTHRKYSRRVAIHDGSSDPAKNWPKFAHVARWLGKQGYDPQFLPQFPSLEELIIFLYESAFFIGNDSGPGHIASCLHIPHLIVGREAKQMRHWRPGWLPGEIATPPPWLPRKIRQNYWTHFITASSVINSLKNNVLCN